AALTPEQTRAIERRANEIVFENRPVIISFEHVSEAKDLRKPSEREGEIRIVSIEGLDRSACGGTHVRSTGEIGPILIRKLDRIRGNVRVEFVCGLRAVERARRDYEALAAAARAFSSPLEELADRVSSPIAALQESEKSRAKMAAALARTEGIQLYSATTPDQNGVRSVSRQVSAIDDAVRALAQGFTSAAKARFIATTQQPPSILLAVSPDAGIHAGNTLKALLNEFGGRGGGNASLAQGSVPDEGKLRQLLDRLTAAS